MSTRAIPLEMLKIASPCDRSWDAMRGDDRKRFCEGCRKHVHNLSSMTSGEAQRLLCESAGSLCVRYELSSAGELQTLDYRPPPPPKRHRRTWIVLGMLAALGAS